MTTNRMELLLQRWYRDAAWSSPLRSLLLITSLFLVLTVSMYPGLRSLAIQLHAVLAGGYIPGHHSVLLINSPNEQAAKDIGRAVMERRLAASVNIFSKTSTMYYWKGEIQDASETLILVRTKTSRVQKVVDYMRSPTRFPNLYLGRHVSSPPFSGSITLLAQGYITTTVRPSVFKPRSSQFLSG